MSNKKLEDAKHSEFLGPLFLYGTHQLQTEAYREDLYAGCPITEDFLRKFIEHLEVPFTNVQFETEFTTSGKSETVWWGVRFRYSPNIEYALAFPKEIDEDCEDGTVSSHHVALYYKSPMEVPPNEIIGHLRSINALFNRTRNDNLIRPRTRLTARR